ncbi:MAG TPA: GIY-YIG nuclease family protein [Sphingomonadaceae bacterium]|nr:GIY-YIG nuclease family protein [Sphingomonadaceae bacterium]
MAGHVYILASRRHGTLYIGVTSDLPKRIYQHREGLAPGFTRKHGIKRLVHVETFERIEDAIVREKRLKEWNRDWKIELLERDNPLWDDLAVTMLGFDPLSTAKPPLRHPGESRDPRTRNW